MPHTLFSKIGQRITVSKIPIATDWKNSSMVPQFGPGGEGSQEKEKRNTLATSLLSEHETQRGTSSSAASANKERSLVRSGVSNVFGGLKFFDEFDFEPQRMFVANTRMNHNSVCKVSDICPVMHTHAPRNYPFTGPNIKGLPAFLIKDIDSRATEGTNVVTGKLPDFQIFAGSSI